VTLERDGTLYRINVRDGSWVRVGNPGEWAGTICGAGLGGRLYTIEKSGKLYETDLSSGRWRTLGAADFANSRFMVANGSRLVTIESDGSLYEVEVD